MAKDLSAIVLGLLEKLKSRGHSEDEIARAVDTHGEVVLDKMADAIAQQAHRPGETFPVAVDYDMPLADAVDEGRYQGVHSAFTSRNFPPTRHGKAHVEIVLVRYDRRMSSEEVLGQLDKDGLRSADLPEFLAFGAAYPEMQRQFCIVSLGSVWKDARGYRNVPCLYEASEARHLDMHWWDDGWYSFIRFAALRK